MHPYLFDFTIGNLRIALSTYSLFALLGILLSGFIFMFLTEDGRKKPVAHIIFLGILMVVSFLGSRLTQFLIDLSVKQGQGLTTWQILSTSGSNVTGGIVLGALVVWIYARIDPHRIMSWHTVDVTALSFPFGHMMGRFGCLSAGCCYGRLCEECPLTITYPDEWIIDALSPESIVHGPRIAAPLIAAIGLLAIGLVLFIIFKLTKTRGQIAPLYFLLYGVFRFFHDYLRGDLESKGIWGPFSTGQWFGIVAVAVSIALFGIYLYRYVKGLAGPPYLPINGKPPREKDAFDPQE